MQVFGGALVIEPEPVQLHAVGLAYAIYIATKSAVQTAICEKLLGRLFIQHHVE